MSSSSSTSAAVTIASTAALSEGGDGSSVARGAWYPLTEDYDELRLSVTLPSGQAFRWRRLSDKDGGEWVGVVRNRIVRLRQREQQHEPVHFFFDANAGLSKSEEGLGEPIDLEAFRAHLEDYFRLSFSLKDLFSRWKGLLPEAEAPAKDSSKKSEGARKRHPINLHFEKVAPSFLGLRLLRQDPEECVFSFLCTQNNNIGRITKMIDSFCVRYGDPIANSRVSLDDWALSEHKESLRFHTFPTLEQIRKATESELRALGFGYRAKFIVKAAEQVEEKGPGWLRGLRENPSLDMLGCRDELTQLMGVGSKVADCVSLFGLDKLDAIPVDTHVWKIAQRYLGGALGKAKGPSNPNHYRLVTQFFKERFGDQCGWAHSVLFAAELRQFQDLGKGKGKGNTKEEPEDEVGSGEELAEEVSADSKRRRRSESSVVKAEPTAVSKKQERESRGGSNKRRRKTT